MSVISDSSSRGIGLAGSLKAPALSGLWRTSRRTTSALVSLAGAAVILGTVWALAAAFQKDLPGPISTMETFWRLVSNPFYDNGPNDKGVGLQLVASLKRVATGFALGSAIGIPLGVLLGVSGIFRRFMDPVVQVLRPVSPLAWFPIGLVVLQSAPQAAVFVVCICSLWPTVINTAFGVAGVPESQKNVARVFQFSRWKYLTRIVLPHSMPHIMTGLRLSMGTAWLVIVAAEMLSGGTGIGSYVWESWNALNLEQVLSAILLIGIVGLLFDRLFAFVAARFDFPEVA